MNTRNKVIDYIYPASIFLLFLWFVTQATYFALNLKVGVPPDELFHTYVSSFYKEAPGFTVEDSEKTYPYGSMTTFPYLYHLAMGKLSWLNVFPIDDEIFLRFFSVFFAVSTLYFALLIMRELNLDPTVKILCLAVITNIPMFIFVSSAVTYDTITNLISCLLLLNLIKYIKYKRRQNFLYIVLYLLVGSITKVTFLPFYLIFTLILVFTFKSCFLEVWKKMWFPTTFGDKALIFIILIFFVLNVDLYGKNLIKHGRLIPNFDSTVDKEKAYINYAQYRRDQDLLKTASERELWGIGKFTRHYVGRIGTSVLGILAHQSYQRADREIKLYQKATIPFLIGAALFMWHLVINIKVFKNVKLEYLAFISVGVLYFIILFVDNYLAYRTMRLFGYSLQGRYLFPVVLPLVVLFSSISLYPKNKIWRVLCLAWISFILFRLGFLEIYPEMTDVWFS